jgi:hypothetical protein
MISDASRGRRSALSDTYAKRRRATKAEMEARYAALHAIVAEQKPMTVRQVFYQATVRGLVPKTENGYQMVATALGDMRRAKLLPFHWIADTTRWQRKPRTYSTVAHALAETAKFYRRSLWDDAPAYVEIWIEKDALSGVVYPVTSEYDVPLMSAKGYPSLSFLHAAAEQMASEERPCFIYQFGDHDPSGVDAARAIEESLREMAPHAEIHFERKAVTPAQIDAWQLPSRPTKASDPRSKNWTGGESVELDAIDPETLRGLVRGSIERHVDREKLEVLLVAEQSEREQLAMFAHEAR